MDDSIAFGVLLPHFTDHGSGHRMLDAARMAEALGFDSVWVRDHLFISPAHKEHGGITDPGFVIESTVALAALSAVTQRIELGAAVITPHRHAMKVAQLFGSLDHLAPGRVTMGIGLGWDSNEFAAVQVPFERRLELVRETVEVCRLAWSRPDFEFHGEIFDIPWGSVDPRPAAGSIPVWYGGLSFKAVELAVQLGEGWIPSRLPYRELARRIGKARERLSPERLTAFTFAAMPQTALGTSREHALRHFDVEKIKAEAIARKPVSGGRSNLQLDDLEGYLIWGRPSDIRGHVERFMEIGVRHIVFDMRASFEEFEESLQVLGEEVLPAFDSTARRVSSGGSRG